MQYAEQPILAQRRTLRLAWVTLLFFFALFVVIIAWAGLAVRNVYQTAMQPVAAGATLVVRAPAETLAWRPADRTIYQGVLEGQTLVEGDSVRAAAAAGFGQVASLRLFDESQLDLWAGSEVTLDALRTSRWHNGRLEIAVRQHAGYVRYDLSADPPFEQTSFRVRLGDAVALLTPGGSYSIDLRNPERNVQLANATTALEADVAVRTGRAILIGPNGTTTELGPRKRARVDAAGTPGLAVPARWELIRDGGFSQFNEVEYNNTTLADPILSRSQFWQVYSGPALPAEQQGFFRLAQTCRPPNPAPACHPAERRTAAWFYRPGQQTSSFTTGIKQELGPNGEGIDISEFRTLTFGLWANVLYQSLSDTGDRGVECPVMIRLVAKRSHPSDPEEQRDFCVYVDEDGVPPSVAEPGMVYLPVPRAEWARISFDLREPGLLPDYRYLRRIQIFAQGHDYDSRVSEISLVGEQ
ncbi:MAG: hypothetical protein AB4911_22510 [Oscillochloridaceae bacterium umkhey_bin13]